MSLRAVAFSAGVVFAVAASASAQERLWTSAAAGEELGMACDRVDDLDVDGVPDLIAGAIGTASQEGSVYAISGATGATIWRVFGAVAGDELGFDVAGLPDVNGDGVADFVAGARQSTTGFGQAVVGSGKDGSTIYSLTGPEAGSWFGAAVARLTDLDGDTIDDFAVGASRADFGAVLDVGTLTIHSSATGAVLRTVQTRGPSDYFGADIANAGDANGDGVADVFVGAPQATGPGFAALLSGATGSLLFRFTGLNAGDQFGSSVGSAGDVDGDGRADVVVGAPSWNAGTGRGMARILSGKDGHVFTDLFGTADGEELGRCVGAGRDIDGDGLPEVSVGAPHSVRHGSTPGALRLWAARSGTTLYSFLGTTDLGAFGRSVVVLGDVDGDGHDELVVGDGSQLHAFRGNDLYLTGDPGIYVAGETVELRTQFGATGGETALFVVAIDGTPHLLNIDLGVLDSIGARLFQELVPAGLAGTEVTLLAFAIDAAGHVADSAMETVQLR